MTLPEMVAALEHLANLLEPDDTHEQIDPDAVLCKHVASLLKGAQEVILDPRSGRWDYAHPGVLCAVHERRVWIVPAEEEK